MRNKRACCLKSRENEDEPASGRNNLAQICCLRNTFHKEIYLNLEDNKIVSHVQRTEIL